MYLNLTISVPADSVAQLNSQLINDSTKPYEGIQACVKILEALSLGVKDGLVELTVRSTDPSVAASGGGITATYDLS